ncbi:putative phosphatase YxeH [Paenibacillus sp. J23TS9]|uniref:Cof-type HAD-IIB family hydrolase n=1 Tax=Paenibacillus sp. J23TS9 TaxID=2807193 RepID=UPI001B2F7F52|nr:Cof-type HAD-IIB family hydrolase [Paenibacillus sp. J23TS9]GIP27641.1 putative phosphatase YxeH [Paenibacillus sp. J23TS9]
MKYKLIALDVDGTLLNDNHELSEQTKKTIQEVSRSGAEIVLCTGRGPQNSIPFMEEIGLTGYVISHNGAVTVDVVTKEVVHQYAMNTQAMLPYMDYFREQRVHFDVNTAFNMYVDSVDGMAVEVRSMYENFLMLPVNLPPIQEFSEPIVKVTAFDHADVLDKVHEEIGKWTPEFNILRSGEYFVDLMHPDASKGNALKQLAKRRGVQSEEVLAIGNYFNDITMLTFAGLGIAMDNSPLEVKAAANEVTASNNEDGVHAALLKYCLS